MQEKSKIEKTIRIDKVNKRNRIAQWRLGLDNQNNREVKRQEVILSARFSGKLKK